MDAAYRYCCKLCVGVGVPVDEDEDTGSSTMLEDADGENAPIDESEEINSDVASKTFIFANCFTIAMMSGRDKRMLVKVCMYAYCIIPTGMQPNPLEGKNT